VSITAAEQSSEHRSYYKKSESGVFGAGFGFTIGSEKQSQDGSSSSIEQIGSTVASLNRDVSLHAGERQPDRRRECLDPHRQQQPRRPHRQRRRREPGPPGQFQQHRRAVRAAQPEPQRTNNLTIDATQLVTTDGSLIGGRCVSPTWCLRRHRVD
jgi:hypothetical protein